MDWPAVMVAVGGSRDAPSALAWVTVSSAVAGTASTVPVTPEPVLALFRLKHGVFSTRHSLDVDTLGHELVHGELGFTQADNERRLTLVHRDDGARHEPERRQLVESRVAFGLDVHHASRFSRRQPVETDYNRLHLGSVTLAAFAGRDRHAVWTRGRTPEKRTDALGHFGTQNMFELARLSFQNLALDRKYVGQKPLGQPVAADKFLRVTLPFASERYRISGNRHKPGAFHLA